MITNSNTIINTNIEIQIQIQLDIQDWKKVKRSSWSITKNYVKGPMTTKSNTNTNMKIQI